MVGAQGGLQFGARVNVGQAFGLAQALQRLGKPGSCADRRPVGRVVNRAIACIEGGACRQAHGLGKRQALAGADVLDVGETLQHALELLGVHLDPVAAQELQAIAALEQGLYFGLCEWVVTQGDAHVEVEQGVHAQHRGLLAANAGADLGACGAACGPVAGGAHHNACGL